MEGIRIHDFNFDRLMDFAAAAKGDVYLRTDEGDVLNLKSRLTQLLVLSGTLQQGVVSEATVVCESKEDETALFRMNLYGK